VAAGIVLVQEAGGLLSRPDGSPPDPYQTDLVASNGPLHPALLAALRDGTG
jgi:myo-inositol-1(or 4)-monophosphatase